MLGFFSDRPRNREAFHALSVTNRSSPNASCIPSVAPGTRVEVSCVRTMTLDRPSILLCFDSFCILRVAKQNKAKECCICCVKCNSD